MNKKFPKKAAYLLTGFILLATVLLFAQTHIGAVLDVAQTWTAIQTFSSPIVIGSATCTTYGTAGTWCPAEGTPPTNVSGAAPLYPDSTAHEFLAATNGSSSYGMLNRTQPGAIRSTGLTGSVTTATLCAAAAGACNSAATYELHFALYQSGTACTANTTNGVSVQVTWTDANGTTHSAQTMPMDLPGGTLGTSGVMPWAQTTLGATGSVDYHVDTNGTIIQYATTFAQCTSGTATYALSAYVTRGQ